MHFDEALKTLIAIALLLALGGCGESKEEDLAACQMEALKLYPNWRADNMALATDMGDFTNLCMKVKGYVGDACPPGGGWASEVLDQCYRKK
jgi:hypothetical protein